VIPRAARRALALALSVIAGTAAAECRLALVLAIDVSSSVDEAEDALQRGGLARALIAPEVQAAFFASDVPVALAIFEWSGRYNQELLLDWTLIDGPEALTVAAETIARSDRSHNDFPTAIGYALGYASVLLQQAPTCWAQTIDVSGDGVSNEGFPPEAAYREFIFDGVTVNGLVIAPAEFESAQDLTTYYRDEVIRGPGAFVEIAASFEDFEDTMRRKLVRELSAMAIGALDLPGTGGG